MSFRLIEIRVAAAVVGLALLTAAGCHRAEVPPPPASGRSLVVVIEGMKFTPSSIHVHPGDQIVFENHDLFPHTATAKGVFDSGPIPSSKSWTVIPPAGRTIPFACLYHPPMTGEIVVEP